MAFDNWKPLRIGAGGYLTGMDIAPDGTMVVRTDTYGAYIWDGTEWQQLVTSESMPDVIAGVLHEGVFEIRIAPSNSNILYMQYQGFVYKSTDKGANWTKTNFADVASNPNDDNRVDGQKMAVDPNNPNVVYVGTQRDGLFVTRDGGNSWTKLTAVPVGQADGKGEFPGITGIVVDQSSAIVYAASYGHGVYRSTNGGNTWASIGGPTAVEEAVISSAGVVYAVGNNNTAVWRYSNNTWTQVLTDTSKEIASIAVDPNNASHIMIASPGGDLRESLNGGTTWSSWLDLPINSADIPWLETAEGYLSVGGLVFDPLVPGKIWTSAGTGVWNTTLTGAIRASTPYTWHSQSAGIEQLVANDIIAPPGGQPVVSSWDRPFFYVADPDQIPVELWRFEPQSVLGRLVSGLCLVQPEFRGRHFQLVGHRAVGVLDQRRPDMAALRVLSRVCR